MVKPLSKQEKIDYLKDYMSCVYNETRPLFEEPIESVDENVLDYWIDVLVENPVSVKIQEVRQELFPRFVE